MNPITIDNAWRPAKKSSEALLKAGYSQKQLNDIGKIFVERYQGQEIENASTEYSKMVRSSGNGHNITQKPDNALETIIEKKSHGVDDGEKRAQEAKQAQSDDGLKLESANMIQNRYGTPFDECKKIVGLEV